MHVYEVRPRKDHRGVDLISDALPFGGCGIAGRTRSRTLSATQNVSAVHIIPWFACSMKLVAWLAHPGNKFHSR